MNSNFPRWIKTSILKHFSTELTSANPFFSDGQLRDTTSKANWIEIHIDGPYSQQYQKNWWKHTVEIITVIGVGISLDAYLIEKKAGIVRAAYTPKITIGKYGTGADDTQAVIACMEQETKETRNVEVRFLGQLEGADRILQAVVWARYYMEIEDG